MTNNKMYGFSEKEADIVKQLREQLLDSQKSLQAAREAVGKHEGDMQAVTGALQGVCKLVAAQQGLTGRLTISKDGLSLTATEAALGPAKGPAA